MVAGIVDERAGYHPLLVDDASVDSELGVWVGRANPLLHRVMHVAIHEQASAICPESMGSLYAGLVRRFGSRHALENAMMKCLGEPPRQAQRSEKLTDEQAHLESALSLRKRSAGAKVRVQPCEGQSGPGGRFQAETKNSIFTPASSITSWSLSDRACPPMDSPFTTGCLPSTWVMKYPCGRRVITAT